MRTHRWLGALCAASILLAGCGGGDGEEAAPTTTTAPPTTSTSTTTTAPPQEAPTTTAESRPAPTRGENLRAKAQSATLRQSDFPPGWSVMGPGEGLNLDVVWRDLTRCLGVADAARSEASALSPTFLRDIATQARSLVTYVDEAAPEVIARALAGPRAQQCLTRVFTEDAERSAPEDARPGPSTVRPLETPRYGSRTMAWRINVTMNLTDLQVPIFQDFLVVFKPRTVIPLFFLNPGSPFPPNFERQLVERVVSAA